MVVNISCSLDNMIHYAMENDASKTDRGKVACEMHPKLGMFSIINIRKKFYSTTSNISIHNSYQWAQEFPRFSWILLPSGNLT